MIPRKKHQSTALQRRHNQLQRRAEYLEQSGKLNMASQEEFNFQRVIISHDVAWKILARLVKLETI